MYNPCLRYNRRPWSLTGRVMPYTDLSLRRVRHKEGFYTSEVQSPKKLPVRTFLPTGYEPNYAYPLLVFFHGQGGCEEQILRLAPRLSRRHYTCIGLRGPPNLGGRPAGPSAFTRGTEGATATGIDECGYSARREA